MFTLEGMGMLSAPWSAVTPADVERACADCEILTTISAIDHAFLKRCLVYDLREKGSRGRSLTQTYPPLGLCKGDRLEVGYSISDLADFDGLFSFPATIMWWRRAKETRCRFRCPLFSARIGVDCSRLAIDAMHTVYLGVAATWIADSIWMLINANAWAVPTPVPDSELYEKSALYFKNDLFSWYRAREREGVSDDWTVFGKL